MNKLCLVLGITLVSVGAVAQSSVTVDTSGDITLSGTQPGSAGNAPSPLIVSPVSGGNASSGAAGSGSSPSITGGAGGNGTGVGPATGGNGGGVTITAGNGGSSAGSASYAPGGGITITTGSAGTSGTGGANGGDVTFALGSASGSGRPGIITLPAGSFANPQVTFGSPLAGLSFHGSPGYVAYSDSSGMACGGWDDQGFRLGNICAIRFQSGGLGTFFTNGCLTTDNTTSGTLSIDNTSTCNSSGHGGNLKLTNLQSYGTVTFDDGTTVGSSGFSYGTGYSGVEWITQPIGTATGNTLSGTANQMTLWGVVLPFPITTSNVSWNITTADNSAHTYDLCLYNSAGTLQAHIGSTAGTTFSNTATGHNGSWTTSSILLQPGIYYEGLTSSCTAACATLGGTNANGVTFLTNTTVSVTSGGTCPGSITPPTSNYVFNASIPALIVR